MLVPLAAARLGPAAAVAVALGFTAALPADAPAAPLPLLTACSPPAHHLLTICSATVTVNAQAWPDVRVLRCSNLMFISINLSSTLSLLRV